MQILNDLTPTRGSNSLDVTMANDCFHENVINWQLIDELNSDHLPTITESFFRATVAHKNGYQTVFRYLDVKTTLHNLKKYIPDPLTLMS